MRKLDLHYTSVYSGSIDWKICWNPGRDMNAFPEAGILGVYKNTMGFRPSVISVFSGFDFQWNSVQCLVLFLGASLPQPLHHLFQFRRCTIHNLFCFREVSSIGCGSICTSMVFFVWWFSRFSSHTGLAQRPQRIGLLIVVSNEFAFTKRSKDRKTRIFPSGAPQNLPNLAKSIDLGFH